MKRCSQYGPLDRKTLNIRTYTDGSFDSNDDHSSQLGYVVLLWDTQDSFHILDYESRKCKRIVTSIMAAETYDFGERFDYAYKIKHKLEKNYRQNIPVTILTDSKQMFDVITKASRTTEKRLLIYVAAIREAYNRYKISNEGLVRSENNVADGLTKIKHYPPLKTILETGIDRNTVQKWIFRSKA